MKSKNLFLIFIFGLFIFLLPSLAEAACSALNYPSNTWQRVWYTYPGGSCLGDGPDESIEQFSNSWGFGTVAWGLSNNIQFTSSRKIYFCVPGDYKFTLNHDDGVRLYVDGSLKLNDWNDGSDAQTSLPVSLTAGWHNFEIDWYENTGGAGIYFSYVRYYTPMCQYGGMTCLNTCVSVLNQNCCCYGRVYTICNAGPSTTCDGYQYSDCNRPTPSCGCKDTSTRYYYTPTCGLGWSNAYYEESCGTDGCVGSDYYDYSCSGGKCISSITPNDSRCQPKCTIGGTQYANGVCNGKCQYCDVSKSTTSWSSVPSGKICVSNSLVSVSATNYCNYGEDCDNGDCSATKWYTSCDGSGSCRAAGSSPPTGSYTVPVTAGNSYVLKSDCSQTSVSTSYYCGTPAGTCNTASTCDGSMLYKGCYNGSCSNLSTYGYTDTADDSACDGQICSSADYCRNSCTWYTGKKCSSGSCTQGYGGGNCNPYTCSGVSCTTICSKSCGATCVTNADCPTDSTCQADCTCSGVPVFDFGISVSPNSGSVTQGHSTSPSTVTATLLSGTSQTISFYIGSGLPSGASASFSPSSCNPTCSSSMIISTLTTTPTGIYPLVVCGTSGTVTRCYSYYQLTVNSAGAVINPPLATTTPATNITQTSATLNGELLSLDYNPGTCPSCSCIVWFEWGTTGTAGVSGSYGSSTTPVPMTAAGSIPPVTISGLTSGQTYYFEAFAKNGGSW